MCSGDSRPVVRTADANRHHLGAQNQLDSFPDPFPIRSPVRHELSGSTPMRLETQPVRQATTHGARRNRQPNATASTSAIPDR
jgi:hypothetical protein